MNNVLTLTPQQQQVYDSLSEFVLRKKDSTMAVLSGFAGTGKTTVIGALLGSLKGKNLRIAVAAPTNKAVRVLRDKIINAGANDEPINPRQKAQNWIEFGSLHSFLGLRLKELEDGSQEAIPEGESSLHEYDVVVIDEASMIGQDLFGRILYSKRNALILFVGDPAQLPPVEPGENISPVFDRVQLQLVLSEVVRQAAQSPIIKLSILIRQAIESGIKLDPITISSILPNFPADAGFVTGGESTIIELALWEIKQGLDARILAYTNDAVLRYNAVMHHALHGVTAFPFVPGETVIVHQQTIGDLVETRSEKDSFSPIFIKRTLITSEELQVMKVEAAQHPVYNEIPACRVILLRDNHEHVSCFVSLNQNDVEREVAKRFSDWRQLKSEADNLGTPAAKDRAKTASNAAWALRRAFAPLRHAYAITAHKSQGSTFDTAIIDLANFDRMKSPFQFNRALYVAVTRPAKHLAIVV